MADHGVEGGGKGKAKSMTQAQMKDAIAGKAGVSKKDVGAVFDALEEVLRSELQKGHSVSVAGLVKISVKQKPAVPAGPRKNPFTGETKHYPAKPASKTAKATALKKLKDLAA